MYQIKIPSFSGPLQLLLELIEKKDREITDVALADVTEDYLAYIEREDVPSEELADFLVVAAKLIYLKSKALMPDLEPEENAEQLAEQLRLYQLFVEVAKCVEDLYEGERKVFARNAGTTATPRLRCSENIDKVSSFPIPVMLTPERLRGSFESLLKRLQPFFMLQRASMMRVVSVEQRIKDIREAILGKAQMTFREITSGTSSKVEVVVSFLALLELMKQKLVSVVQSGAFGEIELKRIDKLNP